MPQQTPSQTVGPFFAIALTPEDYGFRPIAGCELTAGDTPGERMRIEGRVLDGRGEPVADALLDLWQADCAGRYPRVPGGGRAFTGFGRCATDAAGKFRFLTVKPGRVEASQAPHAVLAVFARGLPGHLFTRIYFSDEPGNATDPVLSGVDAARRETLIAQRRDTPDGAVYRFDIRLQGGAETVFFDA